jgi:hypothetical protein
MVDSGAYGITAHEPGIEGLQEFGYLAYVTHRRIEPNIVVISIKDDWHPVVDG